MDAEDEGRDPFLVAYGGAEKLRGSSTVRTRGRRFESCLLDFVGSRRVGG
jgi:hypothetical protein